MWIRRAGVGDVAGLVGFSEALFREDAGSRDPFTNLHWPSKEGREYFSALLSEAGAVCFVAELAGEAVGYLAGRIGEKSTLRPVKVADLESMYVCEECRSSGVGTSLAAEFFSWAVEVGADRVSVTAYAANERAINFYERLGFRRLRSTLETGSRPGTFPTEEVRP